jgi:hypothetical protein
MNQDDLDKKLLETISDLDENFPQVKWNPDDLWETVQIKQRRSKQIHWLKVSVLAATCVSTVVFFAYIQSTKNTEHVTIRYSEEAEIEITKKIHPDEENSNIRLFIEKQCRMKSAVCQTAEFRDLKVQLDELNEQSEKIGNQLKFFGQDAHLIQAHSRIQRAMNQVEKELLQIIKS